MQTFTYQITDPIGIHARPAGRLVKAAKAFESRVTITLDGRQADAERLMSLMALGARHGSVLTVTVEGPDEQDAAQGMLAFFQEAL